MVDLLWEPVSDWAYVGEVFEVRLVARTDTAEDQAIAAIDVAVQWDAEYLELLAVRNDGPYVWLSSGFPDDSAQDGLNDTFDDGDAFYQAWSGFGDYAIASPQGLHVTTFLFAALEETEAAQVSIAEILGASSRSHVYGGDYLGQDVTGQFGAISLRICGGEPGDDDEDGVENCFDLCPGTPDGEAVNPDGCGCSQLDCGDGQLCNGVEGCDGGVCQPGTPPTCDDENDCTADWCDPDGNDGAGSCMNTPEPTGTSCGDSIDTVCDDPDTCDGAGLCVENFAPTTTECRADAGECDVAEYCDGLGACPEDAFEPAGTSCGDSIDTVCDDPDTCDGGGVCLVNVEPAGTPCHDALFCNGEETCDGAGVCQPGSYPCDDQSLPFCSEDADVCVECLVIGDINGDEQVNLEDSQAYPECMVGPLGPQDPPVYSSECRCLDADDDGDVDLADFAEFQRGFTGA